MSREINENILDRFKDLYDGGYRCINYETNKDDSSFTVYLKNFEKEDIRTLKCKIEERAILKNYIDKLQ